MSERAFVARYSPWRTLLGIAGCLGFVAAGLVVAGIDDDPFAPFIGYACAALFGAFALVGLARIGRRGPALRVDAAGIRQWPGGRERLIPWSAVRLVEEVELNHQRFFCVWLDVPERWIERRTFGGRIGDLSLSTHATDRRFADLRGAVRRFAPARLTSLDPPA